VEIKPFFYLHQLNLGRIPGPDNMGFPHSVFLLLTIFPYTLIWPILLSLPNLTCLSLCNENTDSRYIMWCIVSSSHNTLGSLCYGVKTTHGKWQDSSMKSHYILWLKN